MVTFTDDAGRPFKIERDAYGQLVKTVEIAEKDGRVRTITTPYAETSVGPVDRDFLARAGVDLDSLDRLGKAIAGQVFARGSAVDAIAQKSLPSANNECEHCGHRNPAEHEGTCYGCGLALPTREGRNVEKRRADEEAVDLAEYVRLAKHPNSELSGMWTRALIERVGPVKAARLINGN